MSDTVARAQLFSAQKSKIRGLNKVVSLGRDVPSRVCTFTITARSATGAFGPWEQGLCPSTGLRGAAAATVLPNHSAPTMLHICQSKTPSFGVAQLGLTNLGKYFAHCENKFEFFARDPLKTRVDGADVLASYQIFNIFHVTYTSLLCPTLTLSFTKRNT